MKPNVKPEAFSEVALKRVIDLISPILDKLPPNMIVMSENLFPIDVWESTTDYEHTVMGTQLSFLVSMGLLPLEPMPDKPDGKKRYRVTK